MSLVAILVGVALLATARVTTQPAPGSPVATVMLDHAAGPVVPGVALHPGPASVALAATITPATGPVTIRSVSTGGSPVASPVASPAGRSVPPGRS